MRAPNLSSDTHWICSTFPRHREGSCIARGWRWQKPSLQCLDAALASPCCLSGCSHPLEIFFPFYHPEIFLFQERPDLTFLFNVSKREVAHSIGRSHSSHFSPQSSHQFCIMGELYSTRLLIPQFQAGRLFAICSANLQSLCYIILANIYSVEYQVPLICAIIFPMSLHGR